jgi:hypothetical protein
VSVRLPAIKPYRIFTGPPAHDGIIIPCAKPHQTRITIEQPTGKSKRQEVGNADNRRLTKCRIRRSERHVARVRDVDHESQATDVIRQDPRTTVVVLPVVLLFAIRRFMPSTT